MIDKIIKNALNEDIGDGDYSTLSCISEKAVGIAQLLVKEEGIIAGIDIAKRIFHLYDSNLELDIFINDGVKVKKGDVVFEVNGSSRSILSSERLILNFMQRMSGIATQTNKIVKLVEGTGVNLLDTRKTTPGLRIIEKMAVRIGGGYNHRFGLDDMVLLKDNHIDYAGGVKQAIDFANKYLKENSLNLKIEIEVRNEKELKEALAVGKIDRIMLDNFPPNLIIKVLKLIPDHIEVEASGGITIHNIRSFAETGVDFISVGSLTHSFKSLDMSLKAKSSF